jgi:hypothetical protein
LFAEKISSIACLITTINLLPCPDRTVEALLFLPRPRQLWEGSPVISLEHLFFRNERFRAPAPGIRDMRQFSSLLRSTRTRIGRRLAEIVAIAAASLPAAGV